MEPAHVLPLQQAFVHIRHPLRAVFDQNRASVLNTCIPLSRVQSGRSRENHSVVQICRQHFVEVFERCNTMAFSELAECGIRVGNGGKRHVFGVPHGFAVALSRQPESSDCQPFRSGHGRHVRSNFQKIHLESSFISMGINAWPPKTNLVALHCLCPQDESCSRGRIRTARALASNTFNSLSRRNHGWRHAFPFGLGRTGTGTPEKPRITVSGSTRKLPPGLDLEWTSLQLTKDCLRTAEQDRSDKVFQTAVTRRRPCNENGNVHLPTRRNHSRVPMPILMCPH